MSGRGNAQEPITATIAKGLAAGAVAASVKTEVTSFVYDHEEPDARRREDAAREGKHAYEVAVDKVADATHTALSDATRARAANALHWSLGIGSVLAYALARRRYPGVAKAHGLAFGLPFTWLLLDEVANPALGLTPGPRAYPWPTHARGLVGHTALWLTAESALQVMDGPGADGDGRRAVA